MAARGRATRLAWAAWALAVLALVLVLGAPVFGLEVLWGWPSLLAFVALLLTWQAARWALRSRAPSEDGVVVQAEPDPDHC